MADSEMLIVRSASFQQLDKSLPVLLERFPDHKVTMLTHEHGVEMARKYEAIDQVEAYPYRGGFRYFNKVKFRRDKPFDTVIIPVSNLSGSGFYNVLLFSLSIPAKQRYLCNLVSEIRPVSAFSIIGTGIGHLLFKGVSALLAGAFGIVALLLLPLRLLQIKKK